MSPAHEWFRSAGQALPVLWHPFRTRGAQAESPFDPGAKGGRLLLTFDDVSLEQAPVTEQSAIELLRGMVTAGLADGLGTIASDIPHLIPIDTGRAVHRRSDDDTMLESPVSEETILHLSSIYGGDPRRSESVALAESVARVEPHRALRRDVLVSLDSALLSNRNHRLIQDLNVRTPREAARLMGLYLRSRSDYTYRAWSKGTARTSRRSFYLELAQLRLARYWRLHFASPTAGKIEHLRDAHLHLSWSVVSRVAQALQALGACRFSRGIDGKERAHDH